VLDGYKLVKTALKAIDREMQFRMRRNACDLHVAIINASKDYDIDSCIFGSFGL